MKASEIIGSQVLTLSEAVICGVVCDVIPSADLKKIVALDILIFDENDAEHKYLDGRKIVGIGEGVITVKKYDDLTLCYPIPSRSPINLRAYDEKGGYFGKITDLALDEKRFVTSIYAGEKEFLPSDTLSRSEDVLVFRLPGSKTKITKTKKKPPVSAKRVTSETPGQVKITLTDRYAFLVGKRVSEDVTDNGGTPLAVRGDLITDELIRVAKEKQAIVRLTMSAK